MRTKWMTGTRAVPIAALLGGVVLAASAVFVGASKPATGEAQGLEYRVFGIMAACDLCGQPTASPTATTTSVATSTATTTPGSDTPTATPTSQTETPTATPTQETPTATATPTENPDPTCSGGQAEITGLSKTTNPETVTITGSGNLSGWYLISENGNQRFDFPEGFVLNGSLEVRSGSAATGDGTTSLLWTTGNIWNNTEDDDAFLWNCDDFFRSSFEDGVN